MTQPKRRLISEGDKKKEHVNIVFIGHVGRWNVRHFDMPGCLQLLTSVEYFADAGKSTIGGHIMYLTGGVDKRTLEEYQREAKEKNRDSWSAFSSSFRKEWTC